jgi:hypothetical protein
MRINQLLPRHDAIDSDRNPYFGDRYFPYFGDRYFPTMAFMHKAHRDGAAEFQTIEW